MKFVALLVAAFAALTAALMALPAAAQADVWTLRQNAESCYLERTFGSGAGKIQLVIQSFGPTSPYHVVLSGANLPIDKDRARPARVGFGGENAAKDSVVLVGSSGGEPMVLITVAPARPLSLFRWLYMYRPVNDDFVVPLDTAAQTLFVRFPDRDPITLPLGPMNSEYAALDSCAEKVAEKWALAVTGGVRPATPPKLLQGKETLWHVSYPPNLLLNRINGLVELRLTVDDKGRVRDCAVQLATWVRQFGDDACRKFKEEARFEPAKNSAGEPVASTFRTAVMYIIYNW